MREYACNSSQFQSYTSLQIALNSLKTQCRFEVGPPFAPDKHPRWKCSALKRNSSRRRVLARWPQNDCDSFRDAAVYVSAERGSKEGDYANDAKCHRP